MITITNHGQLITATDYWGSEYARDGKLIVSPNAGAIRCLLPPMLYPVVGELRQADYAIVSVGPWQQALARRFRLSLPIHGTAVEILWEDSTESPHVWHVSSESCLLIPGDPAPDAWIISCWVERRGEPHKALERPAKWRRTELPSLAPWTERRQTPGDA